MIHGSAADHTTWTVQRAGLRSELTMLSYDRDPMHCSVQAHADDAAELLRSEVEGPCAVVGSSFGAIVALDLVRRYPDLASTMILCEPPLAPSDSLAPVPDGFACRFDALVASKGGEAAAEFFLRTVLGDDSFERMPKTFRHRSMAAWQQIRIDMMALGAYRTGYGDLRREIQCPTLLLGGERSADFYRDTLDALELAIPDSEIRILRGAGHMMQVDAHRQFNAILRERVQESGVKHQK
jgi:pimeloyl-ACP methyl ester carboxylesterase